MRTHTMLVARTDIRHLHCLTDLVKETVVSMATAYSFDGKNIDQCDIEAAWQNPQVHGIGGAWAPMDNALQAADSGCEAGVGRYPPQFGKSFSDAGNRVDSLRCDGSLPDLTAIEKMIAPKKDPAQDLCTSAAPDPSQTPDGVQKTVDEMMKKLGLGN